jgi:hypothetical protein
MGCGINCKDVVWCVYFSFGCYFKSRAAETVKQTYQATDEKDKNERNIFVVDILITCGQRMV